MKESCHTESKRGHGTRVGCARRCRSRGWWGSFAWVRGWIYICVRDRIFTWVRDSMMHVSSWLLIWGRDLLVWVRDLMIYMSLWLIDIYEFVADGYVWVNDSFICMSSWLINESSRMGTCLLKLHEVWVRDAFICISSWSLHIYEFMTHLHVWVRDIFACMSSWLIHGGTCLLERHQIWVRDFFTSMSSWLLYM